MTNSLITFRSVTPAQRAEQLLQRDGIPCSLQRTPSQLRDKGCSYSVRVRSRDAQQSVTVLRQKEIAFRKVYLLRENGTAEEMAL